MDAPRFDALTRALSTLGSRRRTVLALVGSAPGLRIAGPGARDEAAAKKKHKNKNKRRKRHKKGRNRVKGPCAAGKSSKNSCRRNSQCCTNVCQDQRCRCRLHHQSCTEDRNCCPELTGRVCVDGTCQIQSCLGQGAACPGRLPCCPDSLCAEDACQPCDVCQNDCPYSSIQKAIDEASEGDTIRLCAETFRERITIATSLTLIGAGESERTGTVLDGQRGGAVVSVAAGATVRLEGLRITEGTAANDGGGIVNEGDLTLVSSTVTRNVSSFYGAGISNSGVGVLTLIDCTLEDNEAVFGGALVNGSPGPLTLTDSRVRNNRASSGGGGIFNVVGEVILDDSSVADNVAAFSGGGIYNESGGTVTLNGDSSVTGNTATAEDGGGIYNETGPGGDEGGTVILNDTSSVTGNRANAAGEGGGIYSDLGIVEINDDSRVENNEPDQCGPASVPGC